MRSLAFAIALPLVAVAAPADDVFVSADEAMALVGKPDGSSAGTSCQGGAQTGGGCQEPSAGCRIAGIR